MASRKRQSPDEDEAEKLNPAKRQKRSSIGTQVVVLDASMDDDDGDNNIILANPSSSRDGRGGRGGSSRGRASSIAARSSGTSREDIAAATEEDPSHPSSPSNRGRPRGRPRGSVRGRGPLRPVTYPRPDIPFGFMAADAKEPPSSHDEVDIIGVGLVGASSAARAGSVDIVDENSYDEKNENVNTYHNNEIDEQQRGEQDVEGQNDDGDDNNDDNNDNDDDRSDDDDDDRQEGEGEEDRDDNEAPGGIDYRTSGHTTDAAVAVAAAANKPYRGPSSHASLAHSNVTSFYPQASPLYPTAGNPFDPGLAVGMPSLFPSPPSYDLMHLGMDYRTVLSTLDDDLAKTLRMGPSPHLPPDIAAAALDTLQHQKGKRESRGLRHFSLRVCDKLSRVKQTTYNEMANVLVAESSYFHHLAQIERKALFRTLAANVGGEDDDDNDGFDERNIRRRIYDALNVLMAMDVLTKHKKKVTWRGLPLVYDTSAAENIYVSTLDRVQKKRIHLENLVLEYFSVLHLMQRNIVSEEVWMAVSAEAAEAKQSMTDQTPGKTEKEDASASTQPTAVASSVSSSNDPASLLLDAASQVASYNKANKSTGTTTRPVRTALPAQRTHALRMPFVLVSTIPSSSVGCLMTGDRSRIALEFSEPFQLEDHHNFLRHIVEEDARNIVPYGMRVFCPSIFPQLSRALPTSMPAVPLPGYIRQSAHNILIKEQGNDVASTHTEPSFNPPSNPSTSSSSSSSTSTFISSSSTTTTPQTNKVTQPRSSFSSSPQASTTLPTSSPIQPTTSFSSSFATSYPHVQQSMLSTASILPSPTAMTGLSTTTTTTHGSSSAGLGTPPPGTFGLSLNMSSQPLLGASSLAGLSQSSLNGLTSPQNIAPGDHQSHPSTENHPAG